MLDKKKTIIASVTGILTGIAGIVAAVTGTQIDGQLIASAGMIIGSIIAICFKMGNNRVEDKVDKIVNGGAPK